ncbi:hypothetical protein QC762_0035870 [Podospora pseudocomata]|uniref:Phosphoglycerate mutase-like protein n=1 Tax=Podospora pseudocomata TaxID=2093779 RepID=A0ABR0GR10_9PEZI|nr:hypothetical protein QC762_0035870 [Podospora pseudocomata]
MFTAAAGTVLSLLAGRAMAETVHGVVVFTRHGDRTTKHYGAQTLTNLGTTQNFQIGGDYRARYIESSSLTKSSTSPNSTTASTHPSPTSTPQSQPKPSTTEANPPPLNGYQYITLQGIPQLPDAIWIKGDDNCPAVTQASQSFESSPEFTTKLTSTREFYQSLFPVLKSVYDITSPEDLSYASAYDIYDLINVARLHNSSFPSPPSQLFQLRTLADSAEFAYNFNASQPERSIHARTLSSAILTQLNKTVALEGALKFSVGGELRCVSCVFGLAGLTEVSESFYGLPDYASTMAFELYSPETRTSFPEEKDLWVRFCLRMGLLGVGFLAAVWDREESLSWGVY